MFLSMIRFARSYSIPALALTGLVVTSLFVISWKCASFSASWTQLWGWRQLAAPGTPSIVSTAPRIEQLRAMGELTTLTVRISDVLEGNDEGWFGHKGIWIVNGDAQLTVDLQQVELTEQFSTTGRPHWEVVLPEPSVTGARLDMNATRPYDIHRKIWFPIASNRPTQMQTEAMRFGQKLIEQLADTPEHRNLARQQASAVLRSMFQPMGIDVSIRWRSQSTGSSTGNVLPLSPSIVLTQSPD